MSLARERRMLDDHLAMARSHLETATDAIKAGGSEPLLWARSAAESYVRALEAAVEKHVKAFGELTPLQVPTSGSSQSFRAVTAGLAERTRTILESGRSNPAKDEP